MLLIKTYVDKSPIHGLGVFADEFIAKGTKVWRFVEGFDRCYSPKEYARLPKAAKRYIQMHGYRVDGEILLTVDHDHHINHSERANTHWAHGHIVASRDIPKGAEITNNYRLFDQCLCAAFLKKKKRKAASGDRIAAVDRNRRAGDEVRRL
jgi:SET domain-containing protein